MTPRAKLRILPAVLAAGLLLLPLSACSGVLGAGQNTSSAGAGMSGVPDAGFDQSSAELSGQAPATGGTSGSVPRAEKSVVRTGDIQLTVHDPAIAADEVTAAVAQLGGSVDTVSVFGTGEGSTASLTVRVPADDLEAAFEALSTIGTVTSETRSAVDVTAQHVDLEARVAALETSVARLQELMENATTTSDLLEAEMMLSQRQQELDGLRAQPEALEGQVADATVSVTLTSPSTLPGGGPANFWEGILTGFSSLGAAGAGALVVLGVLIPWLIVAGLIALVVVLLVRGARRRGRSKNAAATPQTVAGQAVPEQPRPEPSAADQHAADQHAADQHAADQTTTDQSATASSSEA